MDDLTKLIEHIVTLPKYHGLPGGHSYKGILLNAFVTKESMDAIHEIRPQANDIFMAGYCKTGTTWVQEITDLITHKGNIEETIKSPLIERIPFIDVMTVDQIRNLDKLPKPRLLKTHLPLRMLPENAGKIIYCVRNPKDVVVSYFYFYKMTKGLGLYSGTWESFLEMFMNGEVLYGNYMEQVMEFYDASKTNDNILIVAFEDVKKNPEKQIRRLAEFVRTQLSNAEMEEILKHTTFEAMSKNPNTNYETSPFFDTTRSKFMRKGAVGDWKKPFYGGSK